MDDQEIALEPTDPVRQFEKQVARNVDSLGKAQQLRAQSLHWLRDTLPYQYSYNFTWLGRPIIQYPQDIIAIQELIWKVKPDLIIETGVAHGGSLLLSASILALLDHCEGMSSQKHGPLQNERRVIGVDIDIRPHNRAAIEAHPLSHKIDLVEGSSTSPDVVCKVKQLSERCRSVMVILDSNHTHDHVLSELKNYAPLVTPASYCVVFDTVIEHLPDVKFENRPWARGNNPLTAVEEFLAMLNSEVTLAADGKRLLFEVDTGIDDKLLISTAPRGYLRRI